MCVIAFSPKNKKFSEKDLRKMWDANPHGAGFAYVDNTQKLLIVKKGFMTFDAFMSEYEKMPETVHAIHFRLASAGGICPELTHPFRTDRFDNLKKLVYVAKEVLFHNGTVRNYEELFLNFLFHLSPKIADRLLDLEDYSDTYVASLYVKRFSHKILKFFDGRWLVLRPKEYFLYGTWDKEDDFYFSNKSWKFEFRSVYTVSRGCPYESNFALCPYKNYFSCRHFTPNCPYRDEGGER